MHVRTLLIATMMCALLISGASVAFASPDSTAWVEPGPDTVSNADGVSSWFYQDLQDDVAKREGGYAAFEDTITVSLYSDGDTTPYETSEQLGYVTNPHGGYDSTSNKCKVCHAVHRAEGAYYLLRANSQDDACDYCHIGGSARSRLVVYDNSLDGKYTTNGHTIGASAIIPDSSVRQELVDVEISTVDENMDTLEEVVEVRRYMERRNAMFRFTTQHGHLFDHGTSSYSRVGPTALSCMSCHQVHNAEALVWKPVEAPAGYKLLRGSPSGSVVGPNQQVDRVAMDSVPTGMIARVPEVEFITAGNTGPVPHNDYPTIWTEWTGPAEGAFDNDEAQNPSYVGSPGALSVWCADCHNLNIGYFRDVAAELGGKSHADRTHPAPFVGANDGPGQCYTCHRNDMPTYGEAGYNCNICHLGSEEYIDMRAAAEAADQYALWDFPHSGTDNSIKLLGGFTSELTSIAVEVVETTVTADNLDSVCLRCHTGIGTRH